MVVLWLCMRWKCEIIVKKIEIEFLTEDNIELVRKIQRDDIREAFVC